MKTVAVITEYNPFHYGHLHQLEQIRNALGNDTRIIAIMSGNFTQRGELAVADKSIRAKAAIDGGVDLILELPFPYSSSSAEFFAYGGVCIANALGVVDVLAFGSECGDISLLTEVADGTLSRKFQDELKRLQHSSEHKELGYPSLCELALSSTVCIDCKGIFTPNNILALEYIKALKRVRSTIAPMTFRRISSDYNCSEVIDGAIQSAGAIRPLFTNSVSEALQYIPETARFAYSEAARDQLLPTVPEKLDSAIISFLRLNSPDAMKDIHDAKGGLYNRLHDLSFEAASISALTALAQTKKYTAARIRRAILNSYFGVTSSVIRSAPSYTQLLGMNKTGRELLKEIKKKTDFPIITKPASYKEYGEPVINQKTLSDKADSIFALAQKKTISGRFSLRFTPYVKKQ